MAKIKVYKGTDAEKYINQLNSPAALRTGVMDAEEIYFFQRELEHIESEVYKTVYPQLKFRELFSINYDVPEWKKTITTKISDKVGRAKVIGRNVRDLPRVAVSRREVTTRVQTIAVSFAYTWEDIKVANGEGIPLESDNADAAREVIEEEMNHACWYGNADYDMTGFLTNADIPTAVAPNGAALTPQWTTKTPDEILLDINALFSDPEDATHGAEKPTDLMLPIAQYNYLANTRMSTTSDTTIMAYIIEKSIHIDSAANIHKVRECKDAGGAAVDYAVAYTPTPAKQEFYIPMETIFLDPQLTGLEYEVPVLARIGGMKMRYPLSANIMTTI